MTNPINIHFDDARGYNISRELYGIFLEDINFSVDGGLNANMVNNWSFEGVYYDKKKNKQIEDLLRYWQIEGGSLESGNNNPLSSASKYARITSNGKAVLYNKGYNNGKANRDDSAISIKDGHTYDFSCYIRNCDFSGEISVGIIDDTKQQLCAFAPLRETLSSHWSQLTCSLIATTSAYGELCINFKGTGTIDIDCISLMDSDYWGKGDIKWQYGKFRKDMVQALKDLHPAFMRFPGGCIVEGKTTDNEYNWKDTVGNLQDRKPKYNLWSEKTTDGGYMQSYQIGFYEYFCLCEDLCAKPLPTLFAGLNCQMRKGGRKIKSDDKEFDDYVVQNYLDLIEFANGNPEQNKWAKLRADMGHPEPFGLDRIGIGNENFGKLYLRNFDKIEKAIHAKYPDIICILSAGPIPFKWLIAKYLKHNAGKNNVWSDVHSYHSVKWFLKNNVRFDRYNRASKIYFGEYSANGLLAGKKMTSDNVNQYDSALAEAVFLTGLERNGDVVIQSSYAPLFNMAGCEQWLHNLIDFNQQCWCPTVNYLVQKLFATNTASRYLPFTSNVPLPKTLCVSATGDSERVYIKVVNSGSDAVDVQLALNDTQDSTITVLYLQSNDVKVRNMLGFNGLPVEKMSIQEDTAVCKDGTIHATIKGKSVTVFRSCIMKRCEF